VVGLDDTQVLALDAAAAKASPGQAFVLQKKRDAHLAEVAAARIDAMADEAVEALEHDAADTRLRPLLSEEATGSGEPMVLNVAVLVDIAATRRFAPPSRGCQSDSEPRALASRQAALAALQLLRRRGG